MTAQDKTFTWGQIGLGSFVDIGDFDDVVVRGVRVKRAVAAAWQSYHFSRSTLN